MFRVEWLESATNDLANAWVQSDSDLREAITTEANALDQRLQTDPSSVGESRGGNERIHFIYPLAATFTVDAKSNVVHVIRIRVFRRKG